MKSIDSRTPFEEVINRHGKMTFRVCRLVAGPYDADELWSDVLIEALRQWPVVVDGCRIQAWLLGLVHDRIHHYQGETENLLSALPGIVDADRERWRWPEAELGAVRAWEGFGQLTTRQRELIAYRYFGGLHTGEVAGITGTTIAEVGTDTTEALATLELWVDDPGGDSTVVYISRIDRDEPQGAA